MRKNHKQIHMVAKTIYILESKRKRKLIITISFLIVYRIFIYDIKYNRIFTCDIKLIRPL